MYFIIRATSFDQVEINVYRDKEHLLQSINSEYGDDNVHYMSEAELPTVVEYDDTYDNVVMPALIIEGKVIQPKKGYTIE